MPAFRQVGEKQLPNPVLCMAWSPKRDLIALANTTGEVGLKSFIYPETCLCIFYVFFLLYGWCLSVVAATPLGQFSACLELIAQ